MGKPLRVLNNKFFKPKKVVEDPFNLFDFEGPSKGLKYRSPITRLTSTIIVISAVLIVLGIIGIAKYQFGGQTVSPFVYFEIKIIDPSGHPVAGATVKRSGIKVGVTDSFGEWRRFMRANLGGTVGFEFSKKTSFGILQASKNLAIPSKLPMSGDIEVSASVQLGSDQQKSRAFKKEKKSDLNREDDSSQNDSVVGDRSLEEPLEPKELSSAPDAPRLNFSKVQPLQQIAFYFISTDETHFSELDRARQSLLKSKFLNALKVQAKQLGLKVNQTSSWKVRFGHLAAQQTKGLIIVDSVFETDFKTQQVSFLLNYQNDLHLMAKTLFETLRFHIPKMYEVHKQDNSWYVGANEIFSPYWQLSDKQVLVNKTNKVFPLKVEFDSFSNQKVRLIIDNQNPCGSQRDSLSKCKLELGSIFQRPPQQGWQRLKVKVNGKVPLSAKIYFSGFQAQKVGNNLWSYWGEPQTRTNITIVDHSKTLFRGSVNSLLPTKIASISIPTFKLARSP